MSQIKLYFILLIAFLTITSCSKDNNSVEPPRDYATQYATDIAAIEDYLHTHYFTVLDHPGFPDDQDVTILPIDDASNPKQASLWSYLNSPTLPRLTSRDVVTSKEVNAPLGGVTYKVYTLVIREGVQNADLKVGGEYPTNVDGVFAGYKGTLLDGTVFDSSNNGQALYNLDGGIHDGGSGVIRGWAEGFPEFKTGWTSSGSNGTVQYNDFGVGIIIIPSALGYYNSAVSVPEYSPLVFSVKLYGVKRYDHDKDGVPSYQEDVDPAHDHYMYAFASGIANPDDTDGDGIPDYLDIDDDNDTYSTKGEVTDINGNFYPFDLIPDCSGNQTDPARLKRYLDKNCIKMNQ